MKKTLKMILSIICASLSIFGGFSFMIEAVVTMADYEGDRMMAPAEPIIYLYSLLLFIGLGGLFAMHHKAIIAFFKSISPKDQSKDKK